MVGVLRVGVGQQLVTPDHQLLGVTVGHAQQATEHPHGQLPGDLGDEVELVVAQRLDDNRPGQVPDGGLVAVDGLAGESPVDQPAHAGCGAGGSSSIIVRRASVSSASISSSRMPRVEVKVSQAWLARMTSWYRVSDQKPEPSLSSHHDTGSSSRRRWNVA